MELKKIFNYKKMFLLLLVLVFYSCDGQKKKDNLIKDEVSCFVRQEIINEEDGTFKYDDATYKLSFNRKEGHYTLLIDNVEYLINLTLDSSELHFYSYKCNNQKILLIEGHDYYGSVFFVYCVEKDNLSSLGNFYIDQPNVEEAGVLKRDFKISIDKNQFIIQTLLDNKLFKTIEFKEKKIIVKQPKTNTLNSKINIKGDWRLYCENYLTEFNVNEKNEVFMFLYSNNTIYINCLLKDSEEINVYNLFFNNVDSQKEYYKDKKNILENEISKEKSIARIEFLDDKTVKIDWIGLYNIKTKTLDFVDDFIMIKENGKVNPVLLKKCDE